jgi:hypothetical protein
MGGNASRKRQDLAMTNVMEVSAMDQEHIKPGPDPDEPERLFPGESQEDVRENPEQEAPMQAGQSEDDPTVRTGEQPLPADTVPEGERPAKAEPRPKRVPGMRSSDL